jgi:hypothetical protein
MVSPSCGTKEVRLLGLHTIVAAMPLSSALELLTASPIVREGGTRIHECQPQRENELSTFLANPSRNSEGIGKTPSSMVKEPGLS